MTDARVSQVAVEVIRTNLAVAAQVSQLAVEVLRPNVPKGISAATGTFTLTGVASTGRYTRIVVGATGAFTLTGVAASFSRNYRLAGAVGAITLVGNAATFIRPNSLTADRGVFTLTGRSAALKRHLRVGGAKGTYTWTGIAAVLQAPPKSIAASTGAYVTTGKAAIFSRPQNIIDPATGNILLRNLRARTSSHADADTAYNAWAATLGVDATGTDYTVSGSYTSTDFVVLNAPPIDYGAYAGADIAHGGAVAFYLTDPAVTTGNYTTYAYGSVTLGYINVPSARPVFILGARNNLVTGYYQNYSLKLRKALNPLTDAQETIVIFTRSQSSDQAYPIRCAFRFCAGYFEAVFTANPANIPSGGYDRVSYIVANESTDIATSGMDIVPDFSGTVQIISDDLSALRPYVDDALAWGDSSAAKYLTYPVQADTVFPRDHARGDYALLLTQNTVLGAATTYVFKPGALVREVVTLADVQTPSWRFVGTLTDRPLIADAIATAYPVSVADTATILDAAAVVRGILVLEALRIIDPTTTAASFYVELADMLATADDLRRFLGGSLADTFTTGDATAYAPILGKVITDSIALSDIAAGKLIFRITADETFALDDATALKAIFRPVVTDGVEIAAGYLEPNGAFTTWAINTRTGAVTEYQNYSFNSFCQNGHKYLGASASGLYELDGDDDAGSDIIAQIKSGFAQFGGSKYSSFKAAYLGMRGNGDIILKLETGDNKSYTYQTVIQDMQSTKVRLGKGLRARYFSFELISTGPDFDLDTVEFIPLVAQRRV